MPISTWTALRRVSSGEDAEREQSRRDDEVVLEGDHASFLRRTMKAAPTMATSSTSEAAQKGSRIAGRGRPRRSRRWFPGGPPAASPTAQWVRRARTREDDEEARRDDARRAPSASSPTRRSRCWMRWVSMTPKMQQHEDAADVDEELGGRQEVGAQVQVEAGHADEGEQQGEGAADEAPREDDDAGRSDGQHGEKPEDGGVRRHGASGPRRRRPGAGAAGAAGARGLRLGVLEEELRVRLGEVVEVVGRGSAVANSNSGVM